MFPKVLIEQKLIGTQNVLRDLRQIIRPYDEPPNARTLETISRGRTCLQDKLSVFIYRFADSGSANFVHAGPLLKFHWSDHRTAANVEVSYVYVSKNRTMSVAEFGIAGIAIAFSACLMVVCGVAQFVLFLRIQKSQSEAHALLAEIDRRTDEFSLAVDYFRNGEFDVSERILLGSRDRTKNNE